MLSEESSDYIDYQLRQQEYDIAQVQYLEQIVSRQQFYLPELWKQWRCCIEKPLEQQLQQILRQQSIVLLEQLFAQMNEQLNVFGYKFTELYETDKKKLYMFIDNLKQQSPNSGVIVWILEKYDLITQLIWAQCRDLYVNQQTIYSDYINGYITLYLLTLQTNELEWLNYVTGYIVNNICSCITTQEVEEINDILQYIQIQNLSIKNIKQLLRILYTIECCCEKANYQYIYEDIINTYNKNSILKKLLQIIVSPKILSTQLNFGIKVINCIFKQQDILQMKNYCSLVLQTLDILLEEHENNPTAFQTLDLIQIIDRLIQICNTKGAERIIASVLLLLEQFIMLFQLQQDIVVTILQQALKLIHSTNRDVREHALNLINTIIIYSEQDTIREDINQQDIDAIYSEYKTQLELTNQEPDQLQGVYQLIQKRHINFQ